MKPCSAFLQWRRKLLDGPVTPAEEARWLAHCAQCPGCDQAWEQEQRLKQALQARAELKAPEQFNQNVWNRIQALPSPALPSGVRTLAWGWTLGMVLVVLAVAGGLYFSQGRSNESRLQVVQQRTPVPEQGIPPRTGDGTAPQPGGSQMQAHTRPDGSGTTPAPRVVQKQPDLQQRPEVEPQTISPAPMQAQAQLPPLAPKRMESRAPGRHVGTEPEPGRSVAEKKIAENTTGSTPFVSVGTVRIRPNKLNLNLREKMLLEIHPEASGRMEARIYTREGGLVKTLVDGTVSPGYQSWEWDGTNDRGERVAAGIYIVWVHGAGQEARFKLAVVR